MEHLIHAIAVESFVPMLRTLSEVLEKGAKYASEKKFDPVVLVNARLAADMYPLSKQVHFSCEMAKEATARLTGKDAPRFVAMEETIEGLNARIAQTVDYVSKAPPADFDGSHDRTIVVPLQGDSVLEMPRVAYLRSWAFPNFYFHVVTAYDILRHNGVDIGKRDYLSHLGPFIRRRAGASA